MRVRVLANEVLLTLRSLHLESLDVGISLVVRIKQHTRPHLVHLIFLYTLYVVLEVVVRVEVGQVVVAILQDDQYLVAIKEFAQQSSVLVVVQSVHVGVVPHLSSTQRRVSFALHANAVYLVFRQQVTLRTASLDHHLREVLVEEHLLQLGCRVQRHLNHLCLAIRVRCEVHHARTLRAVGDVVFTVARHRRYVEALDVVVAL